MINETQAIEAQEAEVAVLGALLLSEGDIMPMIADHITAKDFYWVRHEYIFEAMQALLETYPSFDNIALIGELKKRGKLDDIGGGAYLTQLINETPSARYGEVYAHIVAGASKRRKLLALANDIANIAHSPDHTIEEALDAVQSKVSGILQNVATDEPATPLVDVAMEYTHYISKVKAGELEARYIPTGIKGLDNLLGGKGFGMGLHVIAAPSGMGKTALVGQVALAASSPANGKKVYYWIGEGHKHDLANRALSQILKVDNKYIIYGETPPHPQCFKCKDLSPAEQALCDCSGLYEKAWQAKLKEGVISLSAHTLDIDDKSYTIKGFVNHIRRVFRKQYYDLIVVDHMGLFKMGDRQKQIEVEIEVANTLMDLAKELKTCIIGLAQLNKNNTGTNRAISMDSIRGASQLRDACVSIISIERNVTVTDTLDGHRVERPADTGIFSILKNRHGANDATSFLPVFFHGPTTSFHMRR